MKVDAPPQKNRDHSKATRLFHRDLARERPQLFRAILRFNRSIHVRTTGHEFSSRLDSESGSLNMTGDVSWHEPCHEPCHGASMAGISKILNGSNRAKARLFVNNDSLGFWDFEEESRRMALLDAETLNKVILNWGAAFCSPLLNRIILKQEVELLDQDLGRPCVDFARGRGRFHIGDISEIIPFPPKAVPLEKMRSLIIGYGMQAHAICSAAWPLPLQTIESRRLERDLPELFKYWHKLSQVEPSHFRAIWFSMKKILLKEVAPQWIPCFS